MSSQVSSPNPCSQPLLFNDLDSPKLVADFSGGQLSSDGGLPLLRELDSACEFLNLRSANRSK